MTGDAHLLVGSLAHSSRWRGVLAESEDQPHLVEALDAVLRRLGGVSLRWRFDRMATVCTPGTGELSASFAQVAKHYGAAVRICPPRRGRRKGVVEKANHTAAQRWWRTVADSASMATAQGRLDELCVRVGDARTRKRDGVATTVAALADAEPLADLPELAYPAVLVASRKVSDQALVAFRGNFYSVPPGLAGTVLSVRARLGEAHLEVVSAREAVLARHLREPDGAGAVVRDGGHVAALERIVLAGSSEQPPCRHKARRPLSAEALAEAARLRGADPCPGEHVVVDLAQYGAALGGAAGNSSPVQSPVVAVPDRLPQRADPVSLTESVPELPVPVAGAGGLR